MTLELSDKMSRYPIKTAGSIFIYWLFVSLIPIYNKFFFQKDNYPYPIATAGIQLGVVALLLGTYNTLTHGRNDGGGSWIFGPHLLWKIQWCAPIGILFGLKYGVTNLGLHLVPAPTHLLLQATDLVWTVLSAFVINREHLTVIELLCLVGCIAGSFVLSWHQLHAHSTTTEELNSPGLFAILINLCSPMLLGLCIATLRLACCELMRPNNRVRGTVTAAELTTIKLVISSSVALLLACVFEQGDYRDQDGILHPSAFAYTSYAESWSTAFANLPHSVQLGVMGGALLIAVFQVNCTFLTYLTSAVSVGLVGQVKIIPQWIAAAIFAKITSNFTIQGPNLVGAFLIMASAATFAGSKLHQAKEQQQCDAQTNWQDIEDVSTTDSEDGEVTERPHKHNKESSHEKTALLGDKDCCCSGGGEKGLAPVLSDGDEWSAAVIRSCYDSIREVEEGHSEIAKQQSHLQLDV